MLLRLLFVLLVVTAAGPTGPPSAFAKAAGKGGQGKAAAGKGVDGSTTGDTRETQSKGSAKGTPELGKSKGEKGGQGKAAAGKGLNGGSGSNTGGAREILADKLIDEDLRCCARCRRAGDDVQCRDADRGKLGQPSSLLLMRNP